MDREKQINEIVKIIARRRMDFRNPNVAFMTTARKTADSIYNADYRKQSEPISCSHEKDLMRGCPNNVCPFLFIKTAIAKYTEIWKQHILKKGVGEVVAESLSLIGCRFPKPQK